VRVLAFSGGKDSMACLHLMLDYEWQLGGAIFIDTGKIYPETRAMVEYAARLVPMHIVQINRQEQNEKEGIPSDVVPVNWTRLGQMMTGPKPVTIQSYINCCYSNIAYPLVQKAKELGAHEIVYGQRNDEPTKATSRHGDEIEGMVRIHPIELWSTKEVLEYLETKMEVPPHFKLIQHSSLDCYDCPAYSGETKDLAAFTKRRYPEFHKAYMERKAKVDYAVTEALWEMRHE
jgi:3'-phosphoadenosine 5'-phosphosulfate sulfotransferase (PAPS reductase)/FAD synthetase